jgi:DTW domain-containing protein YfiP
VRRPLPAGEPSIDGLRNEPRPGGLATIEAIARAFELLEGPHVRATLDRVFRAMVERTLWVARANRRRRGDERDFLHRTRRSAPAVTVVTS